MCQHKCKCGKSWSHQDFPTFISTNGNTQRFDPCTFPVLHRPNGELVTFEDVHGDSPICPHCYEEKKQWYGFDYPVHHWDKRSETCNRCGADLTPENEVTRCRGQIINKLHFGEYLKRMEEKDKVGRLTGKEIVDIQMNEEALFTLFVHNMDEDGRAEHYENLIKMKEAYRIRELTHNRLKRDHDIEKLSQCTTDEERAAFEEAKQRKQSQRADKGINVAAARKSKEEKLILSFAKRMIASGMAAEKAVKNAAKAYADIDLSEDQVHKLAAYFQ